MEQKTVSGGKSITSTAISYGLAKIQVSINTMIDKVEGTSLSGVCNVEGCNGSIGNVATCKNCQKVYSSNRDPSLLKAYRFSPDEQILVSEAQRESLKNFDSQILVLGTIPSEKLDIRTVIETGYYLTPQKSKKKTDNQRAYLTIFEGLRSSGKIVVVKFSVRTTQKLGVLMPFYDESTNTKAIVIKEIAYGEQLRVFDIEFEKDQIPTSEEEQQGISFINSLKEIDPHAVENDFTKKFEEILKGEPITVSTEQKSGSSMDFFKQ
jgi:non-homologous end joining protein Ku